MSAFDSTTDTNERLPFEDSQRILFLFCLTLLALPVALRAEEVVVQITIRRGPNADSLNQLQAQITSGSLLGGQEEYEEVMRVALRYARLKRPRAWNCTLLNP